MTTQTILVTGGAGFIGSNFILYFLEQHNDYQVVNLDVLTYAGNLENLAGVKEHVGYTFAQRNICDRKLVKDLFDEYQFDGVIHFAAESDEDNSTPFTQLDITRKNWMLANFWSKRHNEKLIPTIIRKALRGQTIPICSDAIDTRTWFGWKSEVTFSSGIKNRTVD